MDCIINMSSLDSVEEDYSDMPPLVPIEQVSNLPMEMYYGDDEGEEKQEQEEQEETVEYEGIELIDYVNDFLDNQTNYFQLIKSYCIGNNVDIYIQENGQVLSAGILSINNKVHELTRNINEFDIIHDSICKWVNNYYGEVVTGNKLVNNVYIGYNFVPLWRILLDAYEEDNNVSVTLEIHDKEFDNRISHVFITMIIILVIILVVIVGILFMINVF